MLVTPDDTLRHLAAMAQAHDRGVAQRLARLHAALPRAKDVLIGRFAARRVWLFGSLVAGTPTEHSDVDLAVEGLNPDRYFAALADLMTLFASPVDLVRIEGAEESLRRCILAEGRTL